MKLSFEFCFDLVLIGVMFLLNLILVGINYRGKGYSCVRVLFCLKYIGII